MWCCNLQVLEKESCELSDQEVEFVRCSAAIALAHMNRKADKLLASRDTLQKGTNALFPLAVMAREDTKNIRQPCDTRPEALSTAGVIEGKADAKQFIIEPQCQEIDY